MSSWNLSNLGSVDILTVVDAIEVSQRVVDVCYSEVERRGGFSSPILSTCTE